MRREDIRLFVRPVHEAAGYLPGDRRCVRLADVELVVRVAGFVVSDARVTGVTDDLSLVGPSARTRRDVAH